MNIVGKEITANRLNGLFCMIIDRIFGVYSLLVG